MVKKLINARVWIPLGLLELLGLLWALRLPAVPAGSPTPSHIRQTVQCPSQLEALMPLLLRDLPSYANRVSQRAYPDRFRATAADPAVIPGYLLLAGNPDYRPLSLAAGEYRSASETEVPQVFFTTLERQYFSDQAFELQHYHWLFLTPTKTGWQLVLMLSSIGSREGVQANEPPSPPRDSSQGVIAEAIRLWLRDCEAGSVAAPPEPPAELPPESPEIPQQIAPDASDAPRTDRQS